MNIGTFTKDSKGFTGKIGTFGFVADVVMAPVQSSAKGPEFTIQANGGEIGIAWNKTSREGKEYISVLFKGPLFPKGIWAALFETKTPGTFNLVWDEPKKDEA